MAKKTIVIAGVPVEYTTVQELADIMAAMGMNAQAPAKGKKPTGAKAQPKAENFDYKKWMNVPFADMPDDVKAHMYNAMADAVSHKQGTGKKAPELVEFVKKDGTRKMVSKAQADVWEAARKRSEGRKSLDEVKAEYEAARKAFKPSKELIAALKANPVMTRKEAAALGFVGTKDELKALKHKHNVYTKK